MFFDKFVNYKRKEKCRIYSDSEDLRVTYFYFLFIYYWLFYVLIVLRRYKEFFFGVFVVGYVYISSIKK